MDYKYKRNQIFGKRLKVPKDILNKIYNCNLSFDEFIKYQLEDKIPISCIIKADRAIVEKFGIDVCKSFDWELINKPLYDIIPSPRDTLMNIDSQTPNINLALYELLKDKIKPIDYSLKMRKIYSGRLFDTSQENDENLGIKLNFNLGNVSLKEIIYNWELFKDKDLSYCLLNDENNINHITDEYLKKFMSNYDILAPLIIKNKDIYLFINKFSNFSSEEEKFNYLKEFTDDVLNNIYEHRNNNSFINITNEQYREIFKYSSIEDYLKKFHYGYLSDNFINELRELPNDYFFIMPIPFSELLNEHVLNFVDMYGLKNIVDFDNECGHFFTRNNCEVLKLMYEKYLHYANNEHDPNKSLYVNTNIDEKGNLKPYTKDEFYEVMRRIIIYGPSDSTENPIDYRVIEGEFRARNKELFVSQQTPEELQNFFYTKSITPQLLLEHPDYVQYLDGKDLSSCFKKIEIRVVDSNINYVYENIYKFLSSKFEFNEIMNFIKEYSNLLDIVLNKENYQYEINFSINDDLDKIQDRIHEMLRKRIIEQGIAYPKHIPKDLIKKYPSMFLDKNAPKELQKAFYNRKISLEFISSNQLYIEYLKNVDVEVLFKYMPVKKADEEVNLVSEINKKFGSNYVFDLMLSYGKYIEKIFEDNKLKNFKFPPNLSDAKDLDKLNEILLNEIDKIILQNIIDGNMKYDESIPEHFKTRNPTFFLGVDVPQDIKNKFYNRQFTIKDFSDNPKLFKIFGETNIACGFSESMAWIIPLFKDSDNLQLANRMRMKVISAYSKIQDVELQKAFKEYVMEVGTNIDVEKIEYVSEVLSRLSLSNSSEIFTFRKELAMQILKSNDPLESLSKIEDIFIKNNIPTVGKIYSCFEILHPDFQGFNFESSMVSPVLKRSSTTSKKIIVFSDLIKCSFGSNNRSINTYLKNIEFGSNLYEGIKHGKIQFGVSIDI